MGDLPSRASALAPLLAAIAATLIVLYAVGPNAYHGGRQDVIGQARAIVIMDAIVFVEVIIATLSAMQLMQYGLLANRAMPYSATAFMASVSLVIYNWFVIIV